MVVSDRALPRQAVLSPAPGGAAGWVARLSVDGSLPKGSLITSIVEKCPMKPKIRLSTSVPKVHQREVVPPTRLEDFVGCTGYRGPAKSLEEMEVGIAASGVDGS